MMRVGIAANQQGLGALLFDNGPRRGWELVAQYLARWIEAGQLRPESPEILAMHLKAFLDAGLLEPCLYGATPVCDTEAAFQRSIDGFMRMYGNLNAK